MFFDEGGFGFVDEGVEDGFQLLKLLGVVEDEAAQSGAVDGVAFEGFGEEAGDFFDDGGVVFEGFVDGVVGVEDGESHAGEKACRRCFSHADGAGEADDEGGGDFMGARYFVVGFWDRVKAKKTGFRINFAYGIGGSIRILALRKIFRNDGGGGWG